LLQRTILEWNLEMFEAELFSADPHGQLRANAASA
jgi:hypothetical protein